jgi:hypothetical protein
MSVQIFGAEQRKRQTKGGDMRRVLIGISGFTVGLLMLGTAVATPLATLTWRSEVDLSTGQLCVYGSFDDIDFDVFGTSVNLSTTHAHRCIGQIGIPFVTAHCQSVPSTEAPARRRASFRRSSVR